MKAVYFVLFVVMAAICESSAEGLTGICKDVDLNCPSWKKLGVCESDEPDRVEFREKYCKATCQLCKPPEKEECYFTSGEKSKFGCCWDGRTPVSGPNNEGCPVCENSMRSTSCRMLKRLCVDSRSSQELREKCPETCGYCKKAPSSCYDESGREIICGDQCYDIAPEELCKKRKKGGFCFNENWEDYLKTNCAKTCHFCGSLPPQPHPAAALLKTTESSCSDKYGQHVCELHMSVGRCTENENWTTFLKENCAKTCGFCTD